MQRPRIRKAIVLCQRANDGFARAAVGSPPGECTSSRGWVYAGRVRHAARQQAAGGRPKRAAGKVCLSLGAAAALCVGKAAAEPPAAPATTGGARTSDPQLADAQPTATGTTEPEPPDAPFRTPDQLRLARDIEAAPPPPSHVVYLQYGVAFVAEQVLSPGPICDAPQAPCILGAGGGIVIRAGWRSSGPLYLGLGYELTKQDPNKLYRIALLQQARAEGRYYFTTARVTDPYVSLGLGVAGYGDEWAIDTGGPAGSVGVGMEYQITQRTVVGLALAYHLLYFSRFTDTAGTARDPGVAQLLGLNLVLEQRDAILWAGARNTR